MPCPDDMKFEVVRRAVAWFRERYPVVDVDGVRVMFEDGRATQRRLGPGARLEHRPGAGHALRGRQRPSASAEIQALMEGRLRQIIADVTAGTSRATS